MECFVMMLLSDQSQSVKRSASFTPIDIRLPRCRYRGWLITTKMINKQLWMHWQHPLDSHARYGCLVRQRDITATLNHVRYMIDKSIELELALRH